MLTALHGMPLRKGCSKHVDAPPNSGSVNVLDGPETASCWLEPPMTWFSTPLVDVLVQVLNSSVGSRTLLMHAPGPVEVTVTVVTAVPVVDVAVCDTQPDVVVDGMVNVSRT